MVKGLLSTEFVSLFYLMNPWSKSVIAVSPTFIARLSVHRGPPPLEILAITGKRKKRDTVNRPLVKSA